MKEKNKTLNILKLFAAILVVCIHCKFPGQFGNIIINIARVSVPIFFIISGFYSYNNSSEKLRKKIKHIFCLIIICNLIYFIWYILLSLFQNNSLKEIFIDIFNIKSIIKFFIFNDNILRTHLWFLNALLYLYILKYLYERFFKDKIKFNIIISMISIIFIFVCYIMLSICFENTLADKTYLIRNFVFIGIPFFWMGILLNKYKTDKKVSNKTLIIFTVISLINVLVESYFYNSEVYIGTIIMAITLMLLCIKNPNCFQFEILEKFGAKLSLYIYIFHPMLKDILIFAYDSFSISNNFMLYIQPILLIIISIIFSYLLYKGLSKININ